MPLSSFGCAPLKRRPHYLLSGDDKEKSIEQISFVFLRYIVCSAYTTTYALYTQYMKIHEVIIIINNATSVCVRTAHFTTVLMVIYPLYLHNTHTACICFPFLHVHVIIESSLSIFMPFFIFQRKCVHTYT